MIDYNVRAERMGWLPSAPQLQTNPLQVVRDAESAGVDPKEYVVKGLKDGTLAMSCEDPDHPSNWPRNLFVWRSNLLGSSGKGHEYFLKHLLGTSNGVQGKDLGEEFAPEALRASPAGGSADLGRPGVGRDAKPEEVVWHDQAPEGKLDLLVTLDFRMSTTCLYSDIVLPTATWYEKNDLNTSDMHPFIHPLSTAVDPAWQSRSDWEIYKGFAKKFSEVCVGHLGVEREIVLTPLMHDTPAELAQPFEVKEWKRGEMRAHPGQDGPADRGGRARLSQRLQAVHRARTADGQGRQRRQGHRLEHADRGEAARRTQRRRARRRGDPRHAAHRDRHRRLRSDTAARARDKRPRRSQGVGSARQDTGREHAHLALHREDEKIRFRDIQAQPRKIISSPTWSGIESETVSYNAGYTNVHELIPWRTLTGRQQFYMDHPWMIAFGEGFSSYRPPVDLKTTAGIHGIKPNGNVEIALNFITPHQKWGIHSTYTDNLMMLTLTRGGPCVWLSEDDAKRAGIVDNDWIELFNINGAIAARAVVSQRVNPGMVMMYHAQEKIVNTPGSEITGARGGIHNSVTRIVLKPTHMIGGYAQFSLRLQLLRDHRHQPRRVRRRAQDGKVDWLDTPVAHELILPTQAQGEVGMKIRAQIGMVLNLDKCIGCHTCSVTCKNVWTSRPGMEYAWFNNVETKPGIGYPKEWENQDKWNGGWIRKAERQHRAAPGRAVEAPDAHLRQPEPAADRRLLRAVHVRLRPPAVGARDEGDADGAPAQPHHRQADGQDRLGPELGGDPRAANSQAARRIATSTTSRRRSTASSRTRS